MMYNEFLELSGKSESYISCAWNAESSCGIVDRHIKRNTFITGER